MPATHCLEFLIPGILIVNAFGCAVTPPPPLTESDETPTSSRSDPVGTEASDDANWLTDSLHVVSVAPRSRPEVAETLGGQANVEHRRSNLGTSVRAMTGTLGSIGEGEDCPTVLVRFLRESGSLLFDSDAVASEPIQLRVVLPPSGYSRADQTGTIVMFQQEIDGFRVDDNLVSGRCMKARGLVAAWGALYRPSESATRQPLAVPDEAAARAAFKSALPQLEVVSLTRIVARVRMRPGQAVWKVGREQLDAVTGTLMDPIPEPETDPDLLPGGVE